MTLEELLEALENERESFLEAIEGLPDDALLEPGVIGDWSVKDMMAHMTRWEAELVKLLWHLKQGEKPTTVHFDKRRSLDEINAAWYKASKDTPLERVVDDFETVRNQTTRRLEQFSSRDLSDPKRYPVLKGKPLWDWVKADSFGHEAEHTAQIKEWRKNRGL